MIGGNIRPLARKAGAVSSLRFGVEVVVVGLIALGAGVVMKAIVLLMLAADLHPDQDRQGQ